MKAETQSLKNIFQGAMRYEVPLYQRPYVWRWHEKDPEKDRLGPFWNDIRQTVDRLIAHEALIAEAGDRERVAPMEPHFFGAIVIDQPATATGGVVTHEVIDGQQRLTTAQLFIAAAARACEKAGKPKHASRLRKLWAQDDDVDVAGEDRLKLRSSRHDRDSFSSLLDPDEGDPAGTGRIGDAYRYFEGELADWVAELPSDQEDAQFDALRDIVYEHLKFVVIELQPGDNAQGIFESLNAQGERLLAIDLVKNQVFRRAHSAGLDLDVLDTDVWSAEFGDDWWRQEVRQGRYRRPRAELFLMHWLTERTQRDISATGLFVEFSRLFGSDRVDAQEVAGYIRGFVEDASTYRGFTELDQGSRERLFFERRETLDAGVVYPVAIRLWRLRQQGVIDDERRLIALRALESWLVRRMVLRLTPKNYNRVMLEVLGAMSEADDPVEGLVTHLRSFSEETPTGWWPTDDAFGEFLPDAPLYDFVTQKRVRMLLETAEARLHTPKTEKFAFESKLTIEHIIPQTWRETWPLDDPEDELASDRRKASLHRLGNLTLVTSSLNPAMGNDPWAEKRAELTQHSALRLNAQLLQQHPDTFDEDNIDDRGRELAALLVQEWPGPDSGEWA